MRLCARSRNGDERGKSFFCSQRAHCQDMPILLFYTCDTMILSASGTFFSSVLKCLYFMGVSWLLEMLRLENHFWLTDSFMHALFHWADMCWVASYSMLVDVLDASNTEVNQTRPLSSGIPRGGTNHSCIRPVFIKLLTYARSYAKSGAVPVNNVPGRFLP